MLLSSDGRFKDHKIKICALTYLFLHYSGKNIRPGNIYFPWKLTGQQYIYVTIPVHAGYFSQDTKPL